MANQWRRLMMATTAAVRAFRRTYSNPGGTARQAFDDYAGVYDLRWHYYNNSAFEKLTMWAGYKAEYGLYRQTRSLYNPTRRLVDFYAGVVYPGVLATDGSKLPQGTPLAVPLAEDTSPQLRAAIGQLWRWGNWQVGKSLMVRYGAALGDVAVELVDDVAGGTVYPSVVWPGWITDLDLDPQGNVKRYAVEYRYAEEEYGLEQQYTYRKEVDGESIRTYRDGSLYGYDDQPEEYPNPYGFAPLVWVKHTELGNDHGAPALRSQNKCDELNSLASHLVDRMHTILSAPLVASGKNITRFGDSQSKRGSTDQMTNPYADREELNILTGEDASVQTIQMSDAEAMQMIESLLAEIEQDHPEIGMYSKLREQSQVTGPGAERMFGDVRTYVDEARANYDLHSIKLFQMGVAIAGMRANAGDWGELDRQQAVFAPFDLESYARGELDLEILPRPLVPLTEREELELERLRVGVDNDRMGVQQMAGQMNGAPSGVAQRLRAAAQGGGNA